MKKTDAPVLATEEPIGIIISHGGSGDEAPAMFAYEYCDIPESDEEHLAVAAA